MKLHELATAPGNDIKRLYMLKRMIEQGEKPEIADASYHRGHFSWGDLEKLGYAKRGSERASRDSMSEWWTYTGPNSIVVVTGTSSLQGGQVTQGERKQELKTGQSTEPVEVDYT